MRLTFLTAIRTVYLSKMRRGQRSKKVSAAKKTDRQDKNKFSQKRVSERAALKKSIKVYGGGFLVIIIAIFLFYLIVLFTQIVDKKNITSYMVRNGSLAINNTYKALIIRSEKNYTAPVSGTLICFAGEGEHVGIGSPVYAVDERGTLMGAAGELSTELSKEDQSRLKMEIGDFAGQFKPEDFRTNYDFLHDISSSILSISAAGLRAQIESGTSGTAAIMHSDHNGYVAFYTDEYDSVSANDLTFSLLEGTGYHKTQLMTGDMVDQGDFVYKLINSENWSVAIAANDDYASMLLEHGYVPVRFRRNNEVLNGKVTVIEMDGGQDIVTLGFNNSVLNFCSERFTDIEIVTDGITGLKVPVSSVATKRFFTVPVEFAVSESEEEENGTKDTKTFMKQTYLESGEATVTPLEVNVYSEKDDLYYVDNTQLKYGDVLIREDTQQRFVVQDTDSLMGVYNINKGYAQFCQIHILDHNDEYNIIAPDTVYGLREYDYIILDSESVVDDEFIYE